MSAPVDALAAKDAAATAEYMASALDTIDRTGMIPGGIDFEGPHYKRAADRLRQTVRERDALVTALANLCGSLPKGRKSLRATAQGHLTVGRELVAHIFDTDGGIDHDALEKMMAALVGRGEHHGINRGYVGDRPSRKGRKGAKRATCPECAKRGVFGPTATAVGLLRECQYCRATWLPQSWEAALARVGGAA